MGRVTVYFWSPEGKTSSWHFVNCLLSFQFQVNNIHQSQVMLLSPQQFSFINCCFFFKLEVFLRSWRMAGRCCHWAPFSIFNWNMSTMKLNADNTLTSAVSAIEPRMQAMWCLKFLAAGCHFVHLVTPWSALKKRDCQSIFCNCLASRTLWLFKLSWWIWRMLVRYLEGSVATYSPKFFQKVFIPQWIQ